MTVKPFELLDGYEADGQAATEVIKAYVNEYLPALYAEELPPINEKIAEGQRLLLEGLSEFYQLKNTYRGMTSRMEEVNKVAETKGGVSYIVQNPFESHRERTDFHEYEFEEKLRETIK